MATTINSPAQVEATLSAQERAFNIAFVQAVKVIVDRWTLEEIEGLLEQGRVDDALAALTAGAGMLGAQYGRSYTEAAEQAARRLNAAMDVAVSFDRTNEFAVDQIRRNQLRLVREFSAEQIRATRWALQEGITRGLNPREQARAFRASIGLTEKQLQAVANYRRLLIQGRANGLPSETAMDRALRDGRSDRSILRAIRRNRPLPAAQVESMVERYRQRYLNYRANTIARTEAQRATNEGMNELYRQAVELGQIDGDKLQRKWNTARDERVRSSHRRLNGMVRPVGETFPADDGPLRFPTDPLGPASETVNCRCILSFRINQ